MLTTSNEEKSRNEHAKVGINAEKIIKSKRKKENLKKLKKSLKKVLTKWKASDIIAKHFARSARNRTLGTRFDAR